MDGDDYRRTSYETWEGIAPAWERWRARLEEGYAPVREWLVRELAPRSGDTVLELSAGAGDTGFSAAAIVGERGRLISTDFSPHMVEVARRRGAELELRNVDYRVMDAQDIELDSDSVDGVLCKSGYMLMPDPAAALAETRRVLRPAGRLALSVWGPPERNPWDAIAPRILVERGHMPPPDAEGPGTFSMASAERTRGLLEGAGFTAVRIEEVPVRFTFDDLDEWEKWAAELDGMETVLGGMSNREREAFRSQLAEAFAPFAASGRYELPGVALAARAGC